MAHAMAFNSLKFAKKLIAVGIPQNQAEAQVEAIGEAMEDNFEPYATKNDLKDAVNQIKEEFSKFSKEISKEINALNLKISDQKSDTLKWVFSIVLGVSTAQAAIMLTVFKLFFH